MLHLDGSWFLRGCNSCKQRGLFSKGGDVYPMRSLPAMVSYLILERKTRKIIYLSREPIGVGYWEYPQRCMQKHGRKCIFTRIHKCVSVWICKCPRTCTYLFVYVWMSWMYFEKMGTKTSFLEHLSHCIHWDLRNICVNVRSVYLCKYWRFHKWSKRFLCWSKDTNLNSILHSADTHL